MDTINKSFRNSLIELDTSGLVNTIRGSDRKELVDFRFTINSPQCRVLTAPFRYNNIFSTIAETLWVFSGQDDLRWLLHFLPNAINYSDDGRTWSAAYGPRLRNYWGAYRRDSSMQHIRMRKGVDQIQNVADIIRDDPATTQAVISIYGADKDQRLLGGTKDTPCTMYLQFLLREGRLHCICKIRSNDVMWGCYNINVVEWTFLQEILASVLEVEIGNYMHNAGSFHYYMDKEERVNKMITAPPFDIYDYFMPTPIDNITTIKGFYNNVENAVSWIENTIILHAFTKNYKMYDRSSFSSDYIYAMAKMSVLYCMFVNGSHKHAILELLRDNFVPEDLRAAGLEYMVRQLKKLVGRKAEDDLDACLKKIEKRYKNYSPVFDFISGNWYEAYRI